MEVDVVLGELGLSDGEVKCYLALLKLGSVPVSKLKEETKLHRTTIYDFIEKLLNKGLASYVVKNNVKFFKATAPERLMDVIKEKESKLTAVMPKLKELANFETDEIRVEVYKGREGFKTILNDIIRNRGELLGFGIDEEYWSKKFPILMQNYFKREEEAGITERLLTKESTKFLYKHKNLNYKFIPDEYFSPTTTLVYDNKVVNIIQEPFTLILTESAELADAFRKHFELLWEKY